MKWLENIIRKRNTKKYIKSFIENASRSVVLKQWEHRGWGDSIKVNGSKIYGHLTGVRSYNRYMPYCDLCNRDVVVFESCDRTQSEGKKYDIGLFCNVRICDDPQDMFFANYLRLGFADDYSMETIIELAKERIKSL